MKNPGLVAMYLAKAVLLGANTVSGLVGLA